MARPGETLKGKKRRRWVTSRDGQPRGSFKGWHQGGSSCVAVTIVRNDEAPLFSNTEFASVSLENTGSLGHGIMELQRHYGAI